MEMFMIFYAPFIVVILAVVIGFWVAGMDGPIRKRQQKDQ
ncbi:cytochrome bd oxidase small subunit CydS [Kurthia sibirica]|nr:hypothetical protein KSI01_12930 [Kurthia sibirica]